MKDLRTLSHVPRWTVLRVNHRQSVADHSFYVTLYASMLADAIGMTNTEKLNLLDYCLVHDMAEVFTGDMPGPVKRAVCAKEFLSDYERAGLLQRGLPHLRPSPEAKEVCVIANLLDEVCYLKSEIRSGNVEAKVALSLSMCRLLAKVNQLDKVEQHDLIALIDRIIDSEELDQNLPFEPIASTSELNPKKA